MTAQKRVVVTLSSVGFDYVPLLTALFDLVDQLHASSRLGRPSAGPDVAASGSASLVGPFLETVFHKLVQDIESIEHDISLGSADPAPWSPRGRYGDLLSLAKEERSRGFTSSALCGAIFCTAQMANYLAYAADYHQYVVVAPSSNDSTLKPGIVAGFCGGMLPAYAIAQSEDVNELFENGVRIARMAFWMGLQSDRTAARLKATGVWRDYSKEPESWCLALNGWDLGEAQSFIDRFNAKRSDASAKVFISAVSGPRVISIVGIPSSLSALQLVFSRDADEAMRKDPKNNAVRRTFRVPIYTPYHSDALLRQGADDFLRSISTLGLAGHPGDGSVQVADDPVLRAIVYSTIDGRRIAPTDDPKAQVPARLTPKDVAEMICCNPSRWDLVVESIVRDAAHDQAASTGQPPTLTVLNLGPGGRLGQTVCKALTKGGVACELVDLEAATLASCRRKLDSAFDSARASTAADEIAIVAQACRFPGGADTPEGFWNWISSTQTFFEKFPKDRFVIDDYTHDARPGQANTLDERCTYGSFIRNIDRFDPRFFALSPREAEQTDPQHRLLTMAAYEAMEAAGYMPDKTKTFMRDRIGTYVGSAQDDYRDNASNDLGAFIITGNARAFMPGRISFLNKWIGPSASVDTGEMSSLTAIETACDALQAFKCDTALVGGVAIYTSPAMWVGLDKAGLLAHSGPAQPAPFDGKAAGYVRGEGIGVLVLKRLSDALAEGDNILAIIPAIASNFAETHWRSPYGELSVERDALQERQTVAREQLLRRVLAEARVPPEQVSYVECHASNSAQDEATELEAVRRVFDEARSEGYIWLGSVKDHLGNAEAASGMASIFKAIQMLKHRSIPPEATQRSTPNDVLAKFKNVKLNDTGKPVQWPAEDDRATLVINNYSFGGGNTSMLLKAWSQPEIPVVEDPRKHHVVIVSAKTKGSLQRQKERWIDFLTREMTVPDGPPFSLADVSYTTTARRNTTYQHRVSFVTDSLSKCIESLKSANAVLAPSASKKPKVAFFFSGQGSQYPGMARLLASDSSAFRQLLETCDGIVKSFGRPGFLDAILPDDQGQAAPLTDETTQTAIFSIQYSLAKTLESWGVVPTLVAGHSLGEYAAMAVSGVLSLRDALFLVSTRAHLLVTLCKPGTAGMLAVAADSASCKRYIRDAGVAVGSASEPGCEIACENAPESTVVSGPKEAVTKLAAHIKQAGSHRCTLLEVAFAFHSASVQPIVEPLRQAAQKVQFNAPGVPILSNVTGDFVTKAGTFGSDYLCLHSRNTVRFAQGLSSVFNMAREVKKNGMTTELNIGLEIGPHPIVLPMVKESVGKADLGASKGLLGTLLPTLRKQTDDWATLSGTLSSIYQAGVPVDWFEFQRGFGRRRLVTLPSYPFESERYWMDFRDRGMIDVGAEVLVGQANGVDEDEESEVDDEEGEEDELEEDEQDPSVLPPAEHTFLRALDMEYVNDGAGATCLFEVVPGPELEVLVRGHRVGNMALVPAALSGELLFQGAHYTLRHCVDEAAVADSPLEISNLHITGPLVWGDKEAGDEAPRVLVRCVADIQARVVSCMLSSESGKPRADGTRPTSLHATCSVAFGDLSVWKRQWAAVEPLVLPQAARLESDGEDVEVLRTELAYELFSKVVSYDTAYWAMDDVRMTPTFGLCTARLGGKHGHNPGGAVGGRYVFNPLTMDGTSQLPGLMANVLTQDADDEHVYISESCGNAQFGPRVLEAERRGEALKVLSTLREAHTDTEKFVIGDCYILGPDDDDEGGKAGGDKVAGQRIVGTVTGCKFKLFPTRGLHAVLKQTLTARRTA